MRSHRTDSGLDDRIIRIEQHVNERLKGDLKVTLDEGDKVYAEVSEYLQLKNLINNVNDMQVGDGKLKTRVNIGCNVYANDIGLGFYLECNKTEALEIIEQRISLLNERAVVYKTRANNIKAQIKLFLEGLRQLQDIDSE